MKQVNAFLIPFSGLKSGKHQFDYQINNTFFDTFDFDEYDDSSINVTVVLEKSNTMLELNFEHHGTINVACDTTGNPFDLPINGTFKLIVRFGETFNNDNENLLILPLGEHQLDISHYIYEMIVLSVPLKRSSVEDLDEDEEQEVIKQEIEIDPRWAKLKQLITDK